MFNSLGQLEAFLEKQNANRTDSYTLERMQQTVNLLGHPELDYKVVHIAGTSGKGSTCQMIYSILRAAGYSVGIYTSPALVSPLERIVVDGKEISERKALQIINQHWKLLEPLRLTYFELFTVLTFLYFSEKKVAYAVIEVGVGGRLDATNVVTPTVAIVTEVDLDHMELLGNTRQKIAREKEAIIKPGCIGLSGSTYVKRGRYIDLSKATNIKPTLSGTTFSYKSFQKIKLNLVGSYQVRNAILAIEAAQGLHLPKPALYKGLHQVKHLGRFEVISRKPLVIVDGAHNPHKMTAFVDSLEQLQQLEQFQQVIGLISIKYTKDIKHTLQPILPLLDVVIITTFGESAPAIKIAQVAHELQPDLPIFVSHQPRRAYRLFRKHLHRSDLGIITGSLYLIGELYSVL